METMELTKEAKRASILAAYKSTMDELGQRETERMERYFNCQDDYSWGSPYHQAADSLTCNRARIKRDLSLEMLDYGFCTIESLCSVLINSAGEICAESPFCGKFGWCFRLFNGGFVSVPKKAETLANKGYTMHTREVVYKGIFVNRFAKNNEPIFEGLTVISEILTPSLEPHPSSFIDWLYNNQNNTGA
jgi:hypothetical protein